MIERTRRYANWEAQERRHTMLFLNAAMRVKHLFSAHLIHGIAENNEMKPSA